MVPGFHFPESFSQAMASLWKESGQSLLNGKRLGGGRLQISFPFNSLLVLPHSYESMKKWLASLRGSMRSLCYPLLEILSGVQSLNYSWKLVVHVIQEMQTCITQLAMLFMIKL